MKNLNSNIYQTNNLPTWCPGCGNFMVLAYLKQIFAEEKIPPEQIVIAYDIGCAGNMADFIKTYGVHTLHGRIIPVAAGVKYANPKLTVLGIGGDGGVYGEGLNHLVAAARANIDISIFVSNNYLYSLTTGQASPTTPLGTKTKSTPYGTDSVSLDILKFIKSVNDKAFVKRVTPRKPQELKEAMKKAVCFKGFSLLDIEQNCLAFGKLIKP